MLRRVLAALFGAVVFGILVPIVYLLYLDPPADGFTGLLILVGGGALLGALLGIIFPRVFGFIFEVIFDS